MFEKLQKLLFEEDDEDIEEEEEEKEEKKPAKRAARPEPVSQPAPTIKPINVAPEEPSVKPQPVAAASAAPVSHVAPTPLPQEPKKETTDTGKSGFGLTIDTPKAEPAKTQESKPADKKPTSGSRPVAYEFRPVISPMFGVDETDMDAIANTAKRLEETEDNSNVSEIISPIYGTNLSGAQDAVASMQANNASRSTKPAEKKNDIDSIARKHVEKSVEDDLPDFSLDDILNARDEEFARETKAAGKAADTIDETVVIDSKSLKDSAK